MSNRASAFDAERLLHILRSLPQVKAYIVGFSGGADSTALLHALNTLKDRLEVPFTAVHINHGLHAHADTWQQECEAFCLERDIDLVCLAVHPRKDSGKGLEAEARQLRYEAICTRISDGDCLLTAHHADDQAETLLLNLMRGSGVDGLSSMPESRPLGNGLLQRPLLSFQGKALRDYLRCNQVEWSEDPSNQHTDHDRNFVRHEVIPLLETHWPGVSKRLLLTRNAMTESRRLLETLADAYLADNLVHPLVLTITPEARTDAGLLKLAIRRWIKQSGPPSITTYMLESLYQQLNQARRNHKVAIRWSGWVIHLYRQQLWLHEDRAIQPCPAINWPGQQTELNLGNDCGRILLAGADPSVPGGKFSVACRSHTELTTIMQGGHHKNLKNLFQSAAVPPWLRDCIPLCKLDGELVAMGDWCIDDHFSTWLTNRRMKLCWQPENPLLKFVQAQLHARVVDPAGVVS